MKVGYVYDPIYLEHDTGQHVEIAGRLEAIISHLEQTGLKQQLELIKPRAASTEELSLVHHKQHATEAVMDGEVGSAFALVRPPGHHATPQRAMGFCLFNNVAIATKYALAKYQLEHTLIIDFDVHHGNGTQDAFYDSPQVLYISTHQYPHYPGTGSIEETGGGVARGTTVNIPLPAGCGNAEYLEVFEQIIVPVARRFKPQLVLVSAGYDLHWADGIAQMQVSVAGFARMVSIIKGLADELCSGHLVFTLEGGYNLSALADSVKATFDVLLGNTEIKDPLGQSPRRFETPNIAPLIKAIKEIHDLP